MCIAIAKPQGAKLHRGILLNCFQNNPDGAGYAFIEDGRVIIRKGFFSFSDFWDDFSAKQEENDNSMLVHFRVSTHGTINEFNCHPWQIDERHAMIHNGVIQKFASYASPISDTGRFTENILKPMFACGEGIFKETFAKFLIEETIGSWNRVVILGADGNFVIYNEDKGTWLNEVWFSNSSYYPRWNGPTVRTRTSKKKEKKPQKRYRKFGENEILTMAQISELTHEHKCKLKDLVERDILVVDETSTPTVSIPVYGSPEYQVWWDKKFEKVRQEASGQVKLTL